MKEDEVDTVGHKDKCSMPGTFSSYAGRDDLGYYWVCSECKGVIGPMEDFSPKEAYSDFDDD